VEQADKDTTYLCNDDFNKVFQEWVHNAGTGEEQENHLSYEYLILKPEVMTRNK
jgi:hypothetical protein